MCGGGHEIFLFLKEGNRKFSDVCWGAGGLKVHFYESQSNSRSPPCGKNDTSLIPYRPYHPAIDETLKIPEKCWSFLYLYQNIQK